MYVVVACMLDGIVMVRCAPTTCGCHVCVGLAAWWAVIGWPQYRCLLHLRRLDVEFVFGLATMVLAWGNNRLHVGWWPMAGTVGRGRFSALDINESPTSVDDFVAVYSKQLQVRWPRILPSRSMSVGRGPVCDVGDGSSGAW